MHRAVPLLALVGLLSCADSGGLLVALGERCLSCKGASDAEGQGVSVDPSRVCDNAAKSRVRWAAYKLCACGVPCAEECAAGCTLDLVDVDCTSCVRFQCEGLYADCVRDE